ncbi:uncharacterized protein N7515_008058 [Penicillium bovifimosum]|uniref:D-lactate dehydratase n=1 Tax=Penicillium bovifimosum TaxID=126998 RepID=A0A9W9GM92_9EURO|nr:uncharacterized protein N7515_008058 [Penicillium bovifimosum]KAJ5124233.1 hypothetical protein N7515_008058 [Penicillium bovifimosum]
MTPKVLVVLTSYNKLPNGNPSGWYLPEFAHPHEVLHNKVSLTIASPNGGEAPLDPASVKAFESDAVSQTFLKEQKTLWTNTHKLSDMVSRVNEFDAIFYVGGHGPMFDLTNDQSSLALIQAFAAAGKIVSAVCHGPCVLLHATAPSGEKLIHGVSVTGFSNAEEDQTGLSKEMPFMLETELGRVTGGKYVKAKEPWGRWLLLVRRLGRGRRLLPGRIRLRRRGLGRRFLRL